MSAASSSASAANVRWVASERSALPYGWVVTTDPASGRTYYAHLETGKTQWELPKAIATSVELPPHLEKSAIESAREFEEKVGAPVGFVASIGASTHDTIVEWIEESVGDELKAAEAAFNKSDHAVKGNFSVVTGKFSKQSHEQFLASNGKAADKAGRMLGYYMDVSNSTSDQGKKKRKQQDVDWKKYAKKKKDEKRRKQIANMLDQ